VSRLVLAAFSAAWLAVAQPLPERGRAAAMLESPALSERSWGAYLAGVARLRSLENTLIARLRAAVQSEYPQEDGSEYAYIQSMLDALIRMNSTVPLDIITALAAHWPSEAIVLLSFNPRRNEETLFFVRNQELTRAERAAVNNLLLAEHSKKLWPVLLQELDIRCSIDVVDDGPTPRGTPGGSGLDRIAGQPRYRHFPPGFPASAIYDLELSPVPGAVLLIEGPLTVWFKRVPIESAPARGVGYRRRHFGGRDEILEYLDVETGHHTDKSIFDRHETIQWKGAADFTRRTNSYLEEQGVAIRKFARDAHIATPDTLRSITIQVKPMIYDLRSQNTEQLPLVPPKAISLAPQ
jgi:hypothetical protein